MLSQSNSINAVSSLSALPEGSSVRSHWDAGSSQQFNVYASAWYLVERYADLQCDPNSMQQEVTECVSKHGGEHPSRPTTKEAP